MCIPCLNDKMIPLVEYPTYIHVNITLEMNFLTKLLNFWWKISNYPLQRPTGPTRPILSYNRIRSIHSKELQIYYYMLHYLVRKYCLETPYFRYCKRPQT